MTGNTTVLAPDSVAHVRGSTISAPEGRIGILAKAINVEESTTPYTQQDRTTREQKGLSVGAS
ncbi:hypothetical protein, partial [Paraburkholderia sp. SIMBA_054]|uniref:hypothetical protein n=1 Tax=Paraburkholderia sp. SIMBA_054 TaxID=3085795 RepID=UPI003978E93C